MFYLEEVETKQIIVKLLKITFSFTLSCNINNFDGIENGGG